MRNHRRFLPTFLFASFALAPLLVPSPAHADSTVTSIDIDSSVYNNARSFNISGDGSTVVGYLDVVADGSNHAFYWTASGGLVDIGYLPSGYLAYAEAVSYDGSVIIGDSSTPGGYRAWRWTSGTGMISLGTLGGSQSDAYGVSSDGSVVVGDAATSGGDMHAFRWTSGGGMVDLSTLGGTESHAFGVSADGTTAVGESQITGDTESHAFRWTSGTGMVDIGSFGGSVARALDVSGDGSVVVGFSYLTGDNAYHAFRWTSGSGMVDLGTLGSDYSEAHAVTADGTVIVGQSDTSGGSTHAFRWTAADGMKDLNTLLANTGVDMTNIELVNATGVANDGMHISADNYLVYYNPSAGPGGSGVTTGANQQAAAQTLAQHQQAQMVQGRATANEVLGMSHAMTTSSYVQSGAMFGSAVGYTNGQFTRDNLTLIGGIAYGAQDYPSIKQDNSFTFAAALRYTFNGKSGAPKRTVTPFVEFGGWVTPTSTLTLTRSYANGAGTSSGTGSTGSMSWAEYGRAGALWNVTEHDQLMGYAELGHQAMRIDGYSEDLTSNPFPASVDGKLLQMGVARLGGSFTHNFDTTLPLALTFAGAAARSFMSDTEITTHVAGIGALTASTPNTTWGEFGARVEAQVTDHIAVSLGINGTTGTGSTTLHGGGGVSYAF